MNESIWGYSVQNRHFFRAFVTEKQNQRTKRMFYHKKEAIRQIKTCSISKIIILYVRYRNVIVCVNFLC